MRSVENPGGFGGNVVGRLLAGEELLRLYDAKPFVAYDYDSTFETFMADIDAQGNATIKLADLKPLGIEVVFQGVDENDAAKALSDTLPHWSGPRTTAAPLARRFERMLAHSPDEGRLMIERIFSEVARQRASKRAAVCAEFQVIPVDLQLTRSQTGGEGEGENRGGGEGGGEDESEGRGDHGGMLSPTKPVTPGGSSKLRDRPGRTLTTKTSAVALASTPTRLTRGEGHTPEVSVVPLSSRTHYIKLSYTEFCKYGVSAVYPCATELELLELWAQIDPDNLGFVDVDMVTANLDEGRLGTLRACDAASGERPRTVGPGDYLDPTFKALGRLGETSRTTGSDAQLAIAPTGWGRASSILPKARGESNSELDGTGSRELSTR